MGTPVGETGRSASLSGRSPKEANRVIDMADMKAFEADSQSCVVLDDKEPEEG